MYPHSCEPCQSANGLKPLEYVNGFGVRPGYYQANGATIVPGGVSFTIFSESATRCELLIFNRYDAEPYAVIPYPDRYRIGHVFSMIVFGLNIYEFEYAFRMDGPYDPARGLLFDPEQSILDPFAKAVTGQSAWGLKPVMGRYPYRARVVSSAFDWGTDVNPRIPMEDLVIYELHVRGYTRDASAGVTAPGTFLGLREKIPYLKSLGVNAVELLPVFEFDELNDAREYRGERLLDYWGYNPISFFAPNTAYTSGLEFNREGDELKALIRAMHHNGIEVFLDVVYNHTAERGIDGPRIHFKGIDNNIYYLLAPDGSYYNFSGCGNTVNCNHPVVREMICQSVRYWVTEYRVDGFRFDLASILARDAKAAPMQEPPLLESLARDPLLAHVKLIAEAWDAGGMYQVGSFPAWKRWSEWNGRYRDDMRCFLKGDGGLIETAAKRIAGSPDLYDETIRGRTASVNFITCHDGFTLNDLYAYNTKHNEANGWDNQDGENTNHSWNCGVEGDTDDPDVLELRQRMVRNAFTVLLCSRGIPMFPAGDEFGNTQFGNNNPYCQDNLTSWLDWTELDRHQALFDFVRQLIQIRRQYPLLRRHADAPQCGYPEISYHGRRPFRLDTDYEDRMLGVMFSGKRVSGSKSHTPEDEFMLLYMNMHWIGTEVRCPVLPPEYKWKQLVNTGMETGEIEPNWMRAKLVARQIFIPPRTVMLLAGRRSVI